MKKLSHILWLLLCCATVSAQVLISDDASVSEPDPNAILHLHSDNKALLLPRMDTPPANPVDGMIYFDTAQNLFMGYSNGVWVPLNTSQDQPGALLTFVESFDGIESTNNTYTQERNFTGPDNTIWECKARMDASTQNQARIDGGGIIVRQSGEYCQITFPNGVHTISFDYKGAFSSTSGNRIINVMQGGQVLGTTGTFQTNYEGPTYTLSPEIYVNATGPVILRIEGGATGTSGTQAVFDNVTWTRYE